MFCVSGHSHPVNAAAEFQPVSGPSYWQSLGVLSEGGAAFVTELCMRKMDFWICPLITDEGI